MLRIVTHAVVVGAWWSAAAVATWALFVLRVRAGRTEGWYHG